MSFIETMDGLVECGKKKPDVAEVQDDKEDDMSVITSFSNMSKNELVERLRQANISMDEMKKGSTPGNSHKSRDESSEEDESESDSSDSSSSSSLSVKTGSDDGRAANSG